MKLQVWKNTYNGFSKLKVGLRIYVFVVILNQQNKFLTVSRVIIRIEGNTLACYRLGNIMDYEGLAIVGNTMV